MSEKERIPTAPTPPDAPAAVPPVDAEPPSGSEVPPGPETQSERWLKYGVNVVLTSVVVIVLAGIVVWATNKDRIPLGSKSVSLKLRKDVSGDTSNVLKPQTVQLISDLPAGDDKAITLVSLYPKLKKEEAAAKGADTYQRVQDILDEYRRSGKNIKVEAIDPVAEPGKLDAWLGEVKRRYGKNIENYEKFVKEFPKTLEEIKKLAEAEAVEVNKVFDQLEPGQDKLTAEQVGMIRGTLVPARNTVLVFPQVLAQANDGAKAELEQKIPDYRAAVVSVKSGLSLLSRQCGAVVSVLAKLKDSADAPGPAKEYADKAGPRFAAIKAKADEALKKTDNLGELKLDDVRKKLVPAEGEAAPPPAIAVMGPDDVKVIDDFALWKGGSGQGLAGGGANDKPKLRFAGEQQLTSAILGLAQTKKQKVAFVRAGGEPKTTFGRGGPPAYGEVADRLRAYNFDVVEKDLAPAPQQRQMPTPNEPTDEDLKTAVWVVFASPPQQDPQMAMMGMPPQASAVLGERLKAHLDAGGSALCLVDIEGDDLSAALKDWGIEAKPNVLLAHEKVPGGDEASRDFVEQARRQPLIFVLNEFGDHPVVSSLRSLDAALAYAVQVKKAAAVPAGVTVTEIVPMPATPKSWGETDLAALRMSPDSRRAPPDPTFDPATDAPGPVYAGAVAEKAGKGRLVVIGSQNAFNTGLLALPDPALEKAKTIVSRFPANGELFTNSVFWLAGNEKMIALSPSAMDTARIAAVEPAKLTFIRTGLVMIVLPLLAIAAGVGVWFTRRG